MNMISTGAFLTEMDASNKQPSTAEKFAAVWEKKNAKAARAGGVSLMALSLAACGSSSDDTTTSTDTTTTTPTTPATPASFDLTPLNDVASATQALNGSLTSEFRFTTGDEVVNGITATMSSNDVLIDPSATDNDVLNITATGSTAITTLDIETVNLTAASGTVLLDASALTGVDFINVSGSVAAEVDNAAQAAVIKSDSYGRIINVDADKYDGTTAGKNPDSVSLEVAGGTWGTTAATQSGFSLTNDSSTAGETVIETLNVTSSGSAANVYKLDASTNVTLSTVNFLGSTDQTARVEAADVSGKTIKGDDATGTVTLRIDANSTSAAINAANFSGIDNFIIADSTVGSDNASMSSLADGAKVTLGDDFGAEDTVLAVKGATYSSPAASLTLVLDNETANDAVDAQQIDVQNISALNVESLGYATDATSVYNLIDDLVGDVTTVTITGDTSLNLDANVDAKQTATSTAARAVTVDASGMTGTAFLDFAAAANTKVSYTVTGTDNDDIIVANASGSTLNGGSGKDTLTGGDGKDTIDGGAGKDHIDVSYGVDTITTGSEADTLDVDITTSSAQSQVADTNALTYVTGTTTTTAWATGDTLTAVVNGDAYSVIYGGELTAAVYSSDGSLKTAATYIDSADDMLTAFVAQHGTAILAEHEVTVAATTTSTTDKLTFTGNSDGDTFTIAVETVDVSATPDTVADVLSSTATAGVAVKDVSTTITDFSSSDIIDFAGLSLGGTYFEGDVDGTTTAASAAHGVIVITDESYLTAEAAEDDIAASTGSNSSDNVFIFLNSTTGVAEAWWDTDIGAGATTADTQQLFTFENITTLADIASTFSTDSFVL